MRPLLFATALAATMPAAAAPLDAMLSYPFTSELVATRDGSRIAWVREVKGVRNILVADAGGTPVSVTGFAEDDGQELTQLTFSPDGKALWFVRGGDHDGNWPAAGNLAPNPTGSAAEPKVTIWRAEPGNTAAVAVTEGDAPAISAIGRLAYLKDGQVWSADADGKNARRLFFDRGRAGQFAWSPDGTRLAFVSRRDATAYVGIWQDGQPVRFLAPSTHNDGDPVWSADGKRIAFTRRAAPQSWTEQLADPKAEPWRIMVADAATGAAREVWRSGTTRRDSYPDVLNGANLAWIGDRLVFLSTESNWQQLYALDPASGARTRLTPGGFMVEHVAPAGDGRHILYSGNTGDRPHDDDRRHVFRVAVTGGMPEALTRGEGLEWAPVPFAGGAAFIAATAKAPPAIAAWRNGKVTRLTGQPVDPAFPESALVTPQPVTWQAPDGLSIHGQLFAAPGGAAKKPAVIFVHGGPPRQMLLGWSYMRYYSNAYAMNQYLAARGFVVLSVNYRLGIGYGWDFQHPDKGGPAGASEYQDVLAAAKWLQSRPDVDPARIGIWGGSYGGLLTAQALGRNSDVFKAGVDIHGVHDWSLYIAETDTRAEGHEHPDRAAILATAWKSSPVADLAGWRSPSLLIHGDDDRNVRVGQTVDLARRLDARGIAYEELIIPNEIHDFLRHDSWKRVDAATAEFLERHLKP